MTSIDFLQKLLQEVSENFKSAIIKYEFRPQRHSHIIEIMPQEIFESDEYIDAEISIKNKFRELYPNEDLVFISEGSLTKITCPSFIFRNLNVCFKNNHFVTDPIFNNSNNTFSEIGNLGLSNAA